MAKSAMALHSELERPSPPPLLIHPLDLPRREPLNVIDPLIIDPLDQAIRPRVLDRPPIDLTDPHQRLASSFHFNDLAVVRLGVVIVRGRLGHHAGESIGVLLRSHKTRLEHIFECGVAGAGFADITFTTNVLDRIDQLAGRGQRRDRGCRHRPVTWRGPRRDQPPRRHLRPRSLCRARRCFLAADTVGDSTPRAPAATPKRNSQSPPSVVLMNEATPRPTGSTQSSP